MACYPENTTRSGRARPCWIAPPRGLPPALAQREGVGRHRFLAGLGAGLGRDKDMPTGEGRFKGRKRRKVSYLTINKIDTVDYKDINILRRFINDRGKILPSRQTGNTAKQQRMITRAINRARELALLPFVVQEMGSDRKEYVPRRDRGARCLSAAGSTRSTCPAGGRAPARRAPASW